MKTCSKCSEAKPLTEFYAARQGHRGDCKACVSKARAERYVPVQPRGHGHRACAECGQGVDQARLRYNAKYCSTKCCQRAATLGKTYNYKRTLTCADCSKAIYKAKTSRPQGQAQCRDCYRANPPTPKPRATCRDCGANCKGERCRACSLANRKANADPDYESGRRRYYMDKAAPGLNSWEQRRALLRKWQRQGRGCAYCSGPAETVDHVIPLIRGGTNYEGNLVPCCLACNVHKNHRLPIEWRLIKRVSITPVVVVIPPKVKPKAKPMRWAEQAFSICRQCGALHDGKARCCSPECDREYNRVAMRNKYRERVGIPVDAPRWSQYMGKLRDTA